MELAFYYQTGVRKLSPMARQETKCPNLTRLRTAVSQQATNDSGSMPANSIAATLLPI